MLFSIVMFGFLFMAEAPANAASAADRWGVFIGAEKNVTPDRINDSDYKYIVIDAQLYSASEIEALKADGTIIYTYLSIGAVANDRPYYNRFKKYYLGRYDNWPKEKWVNVTKKAWQDFVADDLVDQFIKKGVDGVWIDNTDVYYKYHSKSVFNGLVSIMKRIQKKNVPIIINGGDVFVKKLIKSKKASVIDGVMQEEVLTRITDYDSNKFSKQTSSDQKYFKSYLKKVRKAGLYISVLEYTKKSSSEESIINYCKKHGYGYYISDNVMLR